MTIREKFADPKFLMSKYKDSSMVLLFPSFINRFESNNSLRRVSSSVTFKTWVRFPSAPPREYMFKVNYKSSSHASKRSVTFTKIFKTLEDVTVFLSSLEPLRFISCKKLWVFQIDLASLKDSLYINAWRQEMRQGRNQRKLRNPIHMNISERIGIKTCGTNRSLVVAILFLHYLWMGNAGSNFWGLCTNH